MSSADMNNHPDSSKRTNLHHLFYTAICFLLDLLGITAAVTEELVLNDGGERCDIVISFNAGSGSSEGIFRSVTQHLLIEFKSHYYPVDENAFVQASGYANLFALKLAEPGQMSPWVTMSVFGFTIRKWFLKALPGKFELEKAEAGIYDVRGYIWHVFRFVLIDELVGDEYVCLKLLGENPTLDFCNILIGQIDFMMHEGNLTAVERGMKILEYVCLKHPELMTELEKQGGKQSVMAYSRLTEMFLQSEHSRTEQEKEITALKQSVLQKDETISELEQSASEKDETISELEQSASEKDETISGLKQNVTRLENDLSEKENAVAFFRELLPFIDPAVLAAKARQMGFNMSMLL